MEVVTSENKNGVSYVSVEYADTYFSSRGIGAWSDLTEEKKEQALIKGTDFIDGSFEWLGKKATEDQSLSFPRINLIDQDGYEVAGIPQNLKKAVCIASLMASEGKELFQTAEQNGAVTSETVGSISISYDVSRKREDVTVYDSINKLLRGLYRDRSRKTIYGMKVGRVL